MAAITIPNLGQQGAPGVPLSVQSAPSGQPSLTPPANPVSAPTTPAAPANTAAPGVSPLYQDFLNSASQAGQTANNWQTQQTNPQTDQSQKDLGIGNTDFFDDVVKPLATPFLATLVSGADAINAGKDLIQSGGKPSAQATQDLTASRDLGGFGTIQPFSTGTVAGPLQAAGAGFQMASTAQGANEIPEIASQLYSSLPDILQSTAPNITKLFASTLDNGAASTALTSGLTKTTNLDTVLGKELSEFSSQLADQFPDIKVNLTASQVQATQAAATKAGISLPDFMNTASTATIAGEDVTPSLGDKLPGTDLDISQLQQLESKLNQGYPKGFVSTIKNEIRQAAISQLNDAQPGLGTVYDQMFQTASTGKQALETLNDTFNSSTGKAMTATDISNRVAKVQSLLADPQGKQIFTTILKNFQDTTGVNLGNEADAIEAAGNQKGPLAQRAGKAIWSVLKKQGILGAVGEAVGMYEVFKHGL